MDLLLPWQITPVYCGRHTRRDPSPPQSLVELGDTDLQGREAYLQTMREAYEAKVKCMHV